MPGRTLDSVWWPFTQHGIVALQGGQALMRRLTRRRMSWWSTRLMATILMRITRSPPRLLRQMTLRFILRQSPQAIL